MGLYRVDSNGTIRVDDPINNPLPSGYIAKAAEIHKQLRERGFPIEGMLRSPYYDNECLRATDYNEIRQEEDIDFLAEGLNFFEPIVLKKAEGYCLDPYRKGYFDFDGEILRNARWLDSPTGKWCLWCQLDHRGKPPAARYIVGGDISAGLGGTSHSNSVLSVINEASGEQVAEFCYNGIKPDALARLAVATCHFFSDAEGRSARLNWETNGTGGQEFGDWIVKKIRYRNVWMPEKLDEFAKKTRNTPGWGSSLTTKPILLGDFRSGLMTGDFLARSLPLIQECGEFITDGEHVFHSAEASGNQADGRGVHGDRVIAAAVAWFARPKRAITRTKDAVPVPTKPQPGSLAYRRLQSQQKQRQARPAGIW
jgi:hypothetical protein